jgi:BlaI family transcriptional regulator, penicillinase repressor
VAPASWWRLALHPWPGLQADYTYSRVDHRYSKSPMSHPKLTKLELQIMEVVWARGACSVREVLEGFPEPRPAYTTIQTTVYRMEGKKALRLVKRISNANIFEAAITREQAQSRLIDDLLNLFGGGTKPVMAHLVQSGKLTLDDVKEAERALRAMLKKEKPQ